MVERIKRINDAHHDALDESEASGMGRPRTAQQAHQTSASAAHQDDAERCGAAKREKVAKREKDISHPPIVPPIPDALEDHFGEQFDLAEAIRRFEVAPLVRRYGTWAVTEHGLECLTAYYKIPKGRVHASHWLSHMLEKRWCVPADFADALDGARAYFSGTLKMVPAHAWQAETSRPARVKVARFRSLRVRFQVFKRDGYRCQICGISAQDGARLELDHKVARARGGPTTIENLWTLCFECNRGKSAESL